jgi:hypothetical protein
VKLNSHMLCRQHAYYDMQQAAHANRLRAKGVSFEPLDHYREDLHCPAAACDSTGSLEDGCETPRPEEGLGFLRVTPAPERLLPQQALPEMPASQREAAAAAFRSRASDVSSSSEYALDVDSDSTFLMP